MARRRTKREMDAVLAQPVENSPFDDEPAPDRSSWDKRKRKQTIYLTKKREKELQELKKQDEPDKSSKMSEPARTPPMLPDYIGSRRTLMRFGSTTTTAPASRSASTDAMFASSIERRVAALRSGMPRKRMKDGLAASRSASNVPKSVSSDTSTRSSSAASSKIVESSADCKPSSRTCTASWPAARRFSANRGASALSTRNFRPRRPVEAAARQLPQPRNGVLPRCPRVRGPGNRPAPALCSCPAREGR